MILRHCAAEGATATTAIAEELGVAVAAIADDCYDNDVNVDGSGPPPSPPPPPPTCAFAWFSGPMGSNTSRPSHLQSYLLPRVSYNTGWEVRSDMTAGYGRKTGLVAVGGVGSTVTFAFPNVRAEIRKLNVMTLRSDGDMWRGGKARFVMLVDPGGGTRAGDEADGGGGEGGTVAIATETVFEIEGSHGVATTETIAAAAAAVDGTDSSPPWEEEDRKTAVRQRSPPPITYHFEVDLEENRARVGDDVALTIELVSGPSFKVLGIVLCS